ncbi:MULTISPECIES: NtaA/DmoA family FMN-dependent monooxygenase [unclassified Curtobacterium]|uniref:NtaA/DmoA family FMN-dependent monooxygenase n=1 Tax=unclassified Curtobacterium TaxID=257496 RepID=UPI0008DCF2E9|nr:MULTISPECIES: NtaA/DmoA family FMN-dependent monooxygenase [unclassified Curtobacterium]OIH97086.1 F420-dependent methylene-tetrahydromethanopterin reductase [Curtobacterium sp. MCBA15_003]OII15067.1 F420-dependent methylene-tetrahydromethanopterin reductase [Curtobacterium sp. MCBA15_009]OII32948.1 F420-dependent methylene-tetrahydromethanopterin reductase [Curtobacterium sp. MMLR14_006]
MSTKRQVHLAAHFPGVNNTTVWSDERAESQIAFSSFEHFARNAERGFFDFLFLAEGLRLREQKGRIHDLDVVGRPNTLAILAALAGVTEHIGLVGTLQTTFNEPVELAKQLATLDHLSDGRAGWNVVTSSDAFHGANFRRGGFLDHADRYTRADEFVSLARELWDSWEPDAVVADAASGRFADRSRIRDVDHHGPQFDVTGTFPVPRSPQRHPVVVQAGDSDEGRDLAARQAEVVFSLHTEFDDAKAFSADVAQRLERVGRTRDELLVLPGATFVLGDTTADAEDRSRAIRRAQVSPATAIAFLEQVWNRDLSGYDVDGPLPEVEPDVDADAITRGRVRLAQDPRATVRTWRELAEAERLSIRDLVIRVSTRGGFVGTPSHIAAEIDRYVQERATDGFVVVPHTNPHGLDEFVDRVVPLLQERGVYRTAYDDGATLRSTLGLPGHVRDRRGALA